MNFTLLAAYSLSVVTLLLTPGPVVALITTTASQHGYRRAFLTLIGTNGASLVLIALAALMLAGVVSISAIWLGVLGLVGSLYIGVMAINGLRARDSNPGLCAPGCQSGLPDAAFLSPPCFYSRWRRLALFIMYTRYKCSHPRCDPQRIVQPDI